jgi:preprotein translocase subunit SecD
MPGSWWSRFWTMTGATLLSAFLLLPTLLQSQYAEVPAEQQPGWYQWLNGAIGGVRITWGLDLVGGLHLQYQVDVDKALSDRLDRYVAQLTTSIATNHPDAQGVVVERVEGEHALTISAEGADPSTLITRDQMFSMNLVQSSDGSNRIRLDIDPAYIDETRQYAVTQAIETIRKRIDSSGVVDPSITRRGDSDIIVQLPGLQESQFEQVKSVIGQTAQLAFLMVSEESGSYIRTLNLPPTDGITLDGAGVPTSSDAGVLQAAIDTVTPPAGTILALEELSEGYNAARQSLTTSGYRPILLETDSELTGEYVTNATVTMDPQSGRPAVSLEFDDQGGLLFAELTAANVNRQMAIVLDGIVKSAPNINERIAGGRAQITMGQRSIDETRAEAEQLSIVLRNGALPAPIERQFETQVGPSLGADSVRAGGLALIISFVLVSVFMAWWYKMAGVFSVIALVANMLMIGASLAVLNATLTLPGIAGITLTIGMAVDANVVIYERIKEELALGKPLRKAVDAGYDKAITAVLDSNITTAIAGVVLMEFGSGPIRGFAVTLLIGIASSLLTAILITRLGFDYLIDGRKATRVSI